MWAFFGVMTGLILIAAGLNITNHNKHRMWHILTILGMTLCLVSVGILIATGMLLNGIRMQFPDKQIETVTEFETTNNNEITIKRETDDHSETSDNNEAPALDNTDTITSDDSFSSREYQKYEALSLNNLNSKQQDLYYDLAGKILSFESFSYDAATYGYDFLDELFIVWSAISEDEPLIDIYFRFEDVCDDNGLTASLDSTYICTWTDHQIVDSSEKCDDVRAGLDKFYEICSEILTGLPSQESTYDKYRYLAQSLSDRASYDYSFMLPAIENSYGIVTGKLICQGYAQAYQYLCQQADLWCRVVSGSSGDTAHAWNLIWIDGETYHVDITWADEQGSPGSKEWLKYFMLSQLEILNDHTILDGTEASGKSGLNRIQQYDISLQAQVLEEEAIDIVSNIVERSGKQNYIVVATGTDLIYGEECQIFSVGESADDNQRTVYSKHYAVSEYGLVYFLDPVSGADWKIYE